MITTRRLGHIVTPDINQTRTHDIPTSLESQPAINHDEPISSPNNFDAPQQQTTGKPPPSPNSQIFCVDHNNNSPTAVTPHNSTQQNLASQLDGTLLDHVVVVSSLGFVPTPCPNRSDRKVISTCADSFDSETRLSM